jgi:hypothetical protein
MTDYKNSEEHKGLFVGWKALDWFYFIIALIFFGGLSQFLTQYHRLSKNWALAIFLIPIAILHIFKIGEKREYNQLLQ